MPYDVLRSPTKAALSVSKTAIATGSGKRQRACRRERGASEQRRFRRPAGHRPFRLRASNPDRQPGKAGQARPGSGCPTAIARKPRLARRQHPARGRTPWRRSGCPSGWLGGSAVGTDCLVGIRPTHARQGGSAACNHRCRIGSQARGRGAHDWRRGAPLVLAARAPYRTAARADGDVGQLIGRLAIRPTNLESVVRGGFPG